MKKKYVIFSSFSSNYMNDDGYYYRRETKDWYDGELLSEGDLFNTKVEALERISKQLSKDRTYQIIAVYVEDNEYYYK